jgi:hypothetical protein
MQHTRDSRGNVTIRYKEPSKGGNYRALSVVVMTFLLALAATGALLHFSIKNNASNTAKIEQLEREVARASLPAGVTLVPPAKDAALAAPDAAAPDAAATLEAPEELLAE